MMVDTTLSKPADSTTGKSSSTSIGQKSSGNDLPSGVVDASIPKGIYTIVGIDIDTTGRRLIDEIVQLAAYTPNDHYEQYIMPYMNLNPAARQRHQIRVISIGFYRMLKSMQTYKIIKSKSEIAALKDFLDWLEAVKSKDADSLGIILVYHEERKFIPYMILESLKKYNLLDRFLSTVKSFVNGLNLLKNQKDLQLQGMQQISLRKLTKALANRKLELEKKSAEEHKVTSSSSSSSTANATSAGDANANKAADANNNNASNEKPKYRGREADVFDGSASVRAKLAYNVALSLSNDGKKGELNTPDCYQAMREALMPYAHNLQHELNELKVQSANVERQNSFRPVFLNYFKTTIFHRVRAVKFRIILAEHGYDLAKFNSIWAEKKKEGLTDALEGIKDLKPDDKKELVVLLDSYFDPAKTTMRPAGSNTYRRNRRPGGYNNTGGRPAGGRNNNNNKVGKRGSNTGSSSSNANNNNNNNNEHGAGGDKPANANGQAADSTVKPSGSQQQLQAQKQQTRNGNAGGGNANNNGKNKPRYRRYPRSRNIRSGGGGTATGQNSAVPVGVAVAAAH